MRGSKGEYQTIRKADQGDCVYTLIKVLSEPSKRTFPFFALFGVNDKAKVSLSLGQSRNRLAQSVFRQVGV